MRTESCQETANFGEITEREITWGTAGGVSETWDESQQTVYGVTGMGM